MQYFVKQRATLEAAITIATTPVDVSEQAVLVNNLIAHSLTGTSPVLTAQMQSSDDLDVWTDVGSSIALGATGQEWDSVRCDNEPYGRYVRYQVELAGSGALTAQYSVVLNTHASS